MPQVQNHRPLAAGPAVRAAQQQQVVEALAHVGVHRGAAVQRAVAARGAVAGVSAARRLPLPQRPGAVRGERGHGRDDVAHQAAAQHRQRARLVGADGRDEAGLGPAVRAVWQGGADERV